MRLLLIRHAETPANVAGVLATDHPGPGLTEHGHRQADALGEHLADAPILALHVSTLQRTTLTATPLARRLGLELLTEDGLHEIEAGDLEGRADAPSVHAYLGTLASWGRGALDTRMPGGPDGHAFFARYDAAIERITRPHASDATVALVSHGAAIRVWAGGRGQNVDPDFAATHDLVNTGVVVAEGDPESGWTISSWMGEPVDASAPIDGGDHHDPTGDRWGD